MLPSSPHRFTPSLRSIIISQRRRNPNPSTPDPMADLDPPQSPPAAVALFSCAETDDVLGEKIADLKESQSDLLDRLRGLKHDVQSWRSKLDTQVRTYKDELAELKKLLNTDLEQLRSDFQELRSTLQKQQEDVTTSLRNLGMEDAPKNSEESEIRDKESNSEKSQPPLLENATKTDASDGPATESSP